MNDSLTIAIVHQVFRSHTGLACVLAWALAIGACDEGDKSESDAGGSDSSSNTGGNAGGSDSSGGSSGDQTLTGTFTFQGVTLDCETSTQMFPASGEFSVVCDNDEDDSNYRFVQVTFKDAASARTNQDLTFIKPYAFSPSDHPDGSTIAVSFTDADSTYDSDSDSTGSAKITASGSNHVVTLTNVTLSNAPGDKVGTVSASITY